MGDFFRGWRRKIGIALLAIALVLANAWIRSFVCYDELVVSHQQFTHFIKSSRGRFGWEGWTDTPSFWDSNDIQIYWENGLMSKDDDDLLGGLLGDSDEVEWQLKWAGFEFGDATRVVEQRRVQRWDIPYWSLVLPLTLLSAWLLLIKPRPAKSAKESSRA